MKVWSKASSLSEVSLAIDFPPGSIFTVVKQTGDDMPAPRRRLVCHLSLNDREEISHGLAGGDSIRAIARHLGRALPTVRRETTYNESSRKYRAVDTDDRALRLDPRPRQRLLSRKLE